MWLFVLFVETFNERTEALLAALEVFLLFAVIFASFAFEEPF